MLEFFVGPMSRRAWRGVAAAVKDQLKLKIQIYISLRQASEWGMRALQGTFARLKCRLTSNHVYRTEIISLVILLHNFRTTHVGLNQISTVFNKHYEASININGYDRISRYYSYLNE
jgi:hypothetical protein